MQGVDGRRRIKRIGAVFDLNSERIAHDGHIDISATHRLAHHPYFDATDCIRRVDYNLIVLVQRKPGRRGSTAIDQVADSIGHSFEAIDILGAVREVRQWPVEQRVSADEAVSDIKWSLSSNLLIDSVSACCEGIDAANILRKAE